MPSFTPGPWQTRNERDRFWGYIIDAGDIMAVATTVSYEDAQLIAAAPELLAACIKVYNYLDGGASWAPPLGEVEDALYSAIEKAVGAE